MGDGTILGDGGAPEASGSVDATPQQPRKRVFLTADEFKGDLRAAGNAADPFAAADKLCQVAALDAHLGGAWHAFLSGKFNGQTISAVDRVGNGPYYLLDRNTLVFDNKTRMSADALAAIHITERGDIPTGGVYVWTGTRLGAYRAPGCENDAGDSWTSAQSWGTAGWSQFAASWCFGQDDGKGSSCAFPASLYCFEDD